MTQPPPPEQPPEPPASDAVPEPPTGDVPTAPSEPPASDAAATTEPAPTDPVTQPATAPVVASPAYAAPTASALDRVRAAYQRRNETDYIFNYWTALGWTLLTCGIYGLYIVYQLARRSRDHNARRLEELDAATTFAWEQAGTRGLQDELRPNFERIATHLAAMRQATTEFRDPVIWTVLAVFASGIVQIVLYILLDSDLVKHEYQEGGAEHELAQVYGRLGASLPSPDPSHLHQAHNYVARVIVLLVTCGFYHFWWLYNVMTELNQHFEADWAWEDSLAGAVQSLAG